MGPQWQGCATPGDLFNRTCAKYGISLLQYLYIYKRVTFPYKNLRQRRCKGVVAIYAFVITLRQIKKSEPTHWEAVLFPVEAQEDRFVVDWNPVPYKTHGIHPKYSRHSVATRSRKRG